MKTTALTDLSLEELTGLLESWGEPAFHASQMWHWFYRSLVTSFAEMSDLPLRLRQRLDSEAVLQTLQPLKELTSTDGRTTKVLFRLGDDMTIESVSMRQRGASGAQGRHTVCVSTQVGCPIGCPFCATGQHGLQRNLSSGEIVEQVLYFARARPTEPVSNVVFMGMGEPLLNYDATMKAIRTLNSPHGFNLGTRHMTISTAGLVPGIRRLAREGLQVGLAISLHAASDTLRDKLVPLNRRYPLRELLTACRDYFAATGRRITFEYVLFDGVNDSIKHAAQLSRLLSGMNCHVNLIRANPAAGSPFQPSSREQAMKFLAELRRRSITVTLRRSLGTDIQAGCGQLRSAECHEVAASRNPSHPRTSKRSVARPKTPRY